MNRPRLIRVRYTAEVEIWSDELERITGPAALSTWKADPDSPEGRMVAAKAIGLAGDRLGYSDVKHVRLQAVNSRA